MHTGMLWFSPKNTEFADNLKKAVDYYQKKHGRKPDLCLVHPSTLEVGVKKLTIDGLEVRAYRPVLPGHIWVGIADKD